jgi:hypothetical protein
MFDDITETQLTDYPEYGHADSREVDDTTIAVEYTTICTLDVDWFWEV